MIARHCYVLYYNYGIALAISTNQKIAPNKLEIPIALIDHFLYLKSNNNPHNRRIGPQ